MHPRTARWLSSARNLHHLKMSCGERCSCRTTIDTMAVAKRVAAVERCYGVALPPSYREFLLRYDGWQHAFRRTSLLSTEQLLNPSWLHRAEIVLDRIAVPSVRRARASDLGMRATDPAVSEENLIAFGLDDAGSTVFVFDANTCDESGEMEVLAWFSGLGIRVPSFPWLLDMLCDLTTSTRESSFPQSVCAA